MLEHNYMNLTWTAAEEFCFSKGGHLASVASLFHWRRLKTFLARKGLFWENLSLGDEAREGEWTWTDASKWSVDALDA